MRETVALVGRHLRSVVRGRPGRIVLALGLVALVAVLMLARDGEAARATVFLGSFVVLGLLSLGGAVQAGSLLPTDRAEGSEVWLATLAPAGWSRRLSAAFSGMALALGVAVVGALLLAVILPALLPGTTVRGHRSLEIPSGLDARASASQRRTVTIDFGTPAGTDATLSLGLGPRYVRWKTDDTTLTKRIAVHWTTEGGAPPAQGSETLARGAPLLLEVAPGTRRLVLASSDADVDVVVKDARLLGGARSLLFTLLMAGIVLGLVAAALAPIATVVSRWTSAPTATAVGLVLAFVGGLRLLLVDLAVPDAGWLHDLGMAVIGAASLLAPDLEVLGTLGEPAAGRALDLSLLGGLLPVVIYACIALALLALPTRAEPAHGRSS